MTAFRYQAVDQAGATRKGVVNADSPRAARADLRAQGLVPLNVDAIVLHWAIATAIIGNLLLGLWMHEAVDVAATQARAITAFQLHKSLGLTILLLSVLRLVWRLLHHPPALPTAMTVWERTAARSAHWAFYGLMLALPLSGWLYVSTQWRGSVPLNVPTLWFGLFEVPHLLGIDTFTRELRQTYAGWAIEAHELLAWGAVALLVLHVLAALKHHFRDRDEVLASMLPLVRHANLPRLDGGRKTLLTGSAVATAVAAAAILVAVFAVPLAVPVADGTAGRSSVSSALDSAASAEPAADVLTDAAATATTTWIVDPAASAIRFSGTHAGVAFKGRFTRWRAALMFDVADPAGSRISASVETGSATDGVALHDRTLPGAEWFDIARHPTAEYRSTAIRPNADGSFEIDGVLRIKGRAIRIAPLTMTLAGDQLKIQGQTRISRTDADLGMESDPDAAYVSRDIGLDVQVSATRAP